MKLPSNPTARRWPRSTPRRSLEKSEPPCAWTNLTLVPFFYRYIATVAAPWRTPQRDRIQRSTIVLQPCIKEMVLPDTVNAQILPRKSFALEARFVEQPDGSDVARNA